MANVPPFSVIRRIREHVFRACILSRLRLMADFSGCLWVETAQLLSFTFPPPAAHLTVLSQLTYQKVC